MSVAYKVRHRSRPTACDAPAEPGMNPARDEQPSASPSDTRADGNYAVGYGKPPVHTRFRKGRSGNPRGRPKGAKNLKTDLTEELCELILVREGERAHRVTKQRAILKSLAAKAMKGDMRAMGLVANLVLRFTPPDDEGSAAAKNATRLDGEATRSLDDTDQAILRAYGQCLLEEEQQKLNHRAAPDQNVGTAKPSPSDDEEACHE